MRLFFLALFPFPQARHSHSSSHTFFLLFSSSVSCSYFAPANPDLFELHATSLFNAPARSCGAAVQRVESGAEQTLAVSRNNTAVQPSPAPPPFLCVLLSPTHSTLPSSLYMPVSSSFLCGEDVSPGSCDISLACRVRHACSAGKACRHWSVFVPPSSPPGVRQLPFSLIPSLAPHIPLLTPALRTELIILSTHHFGAIGRQRSRGERWIGKERRG